MVIKEFDYGNVSTPLSITYHYKCIPLMLFCFVLLGTQNW